MEPRRWSVSYSRDGSDVILYNLDRRARAWAAAEAFANLLCGLTNGRLFGHGLGEWAWRIPVGRARWDRTDPGDPWLENSLAGCLMDMENAVLYRSGDAQERCRVGTLPIDTDALLRLAPDFAFLFEGDDGETPREG